MLRNNNKLEIQAEFICNTISENNYENITEFFCTDGISDTQQEIKHIKSLLRLMMMDLQLILTNLQNHNRFLTFFKYKNDNMTPVNVSINDKVVCPLLRSLEHFKEMKSQPQKFY